MRQINQVVCLFAALMLPLLAAQPAFGWGSDGHKIINRLAGAALPADVPAFLRSPAALDALEYYGPEPDRWRSPAEPELNAAQAPEHFIDLEYADLIGKLPRRRYDYIRALAAAQAAHPEIRLTPEKVGLQPYVTSEVYERLQSAFRDYRALLAAKQNTKPSEAEIVFLAGWLGHYVADGSMPLHTSIQYNGWTGPNPHGYTTEHHIHAQFESDFVHENVNLADVAPLVAATKPTTLNDVFAEYLLYLRHSNSLVEKTYQLDKEGAFTGAGTPAGKAFVDQQLAAGVIELRNMIYTAWVKSAEPVPVYQGN
ncbi:MAG: nuclease [Acidobacteriaceae bacterium]|nr:nuclease [Acidobacteriaceae bacterium]